MQITIDTRTPLNGTEREILAMLISLEQTPEPAPEPAPEPDIQSDDATTRTIELCSSGKVEQVREILNGYGASRVSELSPDQVPAYLEALAEL